MYVKMNISFQVYIFEQEINSNIFCVFHIIKNTLTIDYDYFKYMDKVCIHFTKIKLDDIAIQFFITEHN